MCNFKTFIVSVMNDKRRGPAAAVTGFLLLAASWAYALGIAIVGAGYRTGIRKVRKAPVPVVSVGNITLGGTGKTPFTIFLAEYLLGAGRRPAVLTRGYGSDEDKMTKEELAEVPVHVGRQRYRSAEKAAAWGCDVLLMDDGFQHRSLRRDLDIVLVDSVSGFGNGKLFPRGVLREPLSAIKRADIVVLTKTDMAGEERTEKIRLEISRVSGAEKFVYAAHRPLFLSDAAGAGYETGMLEGKRVCMVSGIVDPEYLRFIIERAGADVVSSVAFDDHHAYTAKDAIRIKKAFSGSAADTMVTTKKDHVKLRNLDIGPLEERLFVLNVVMEIKKGKEILFAGLNNVICD